MLLDRLNMTICDMLHEIGYLMGFKWIRVEDGLYNASVFARTQDEAKTSDGYSTGKRVPLCVYLETQEGLNSLLSLLTEEERGDYDGVLAVVRCSEPGHNVWYSQSELSQERAQIVESFSRVKWWWKFPDDKRHTNEERNARWRKEIASWPSSTA